MVENFIGFPAGLSGAELAMRGVLQMLKFGAKWSRRLSSKISIRSRMERATTCASAAAQFCTRRSFSSPPE